MYTGQDQGEMLCGTRRENFKIKKMWWRIWLRCYHQRLLFLLDTAAAGLNSAARLFFLSDLSVRAHTQRFTPCSAHADTHTHTRAHTHTRTHTRTHTHTHAHAHTHTHKPSTNIIIGLKRSSIFAYRLTVNTNDRFIGLTIIDYCD